MQQVNQPRWTTNLFVTLVVLSTISILIIIFANVAGYSQRVKPSEVLLYLITSALGVAIYADQ